ncbi:MAG: hypothetical protein EP340_04560 [Alphaproteobacteria bacterium]|nr:MAG: hypothetical protein EP340_04560 [Alphaproteobacteria bacterium]
MRKAVYIAIAAGFIFLMLLVGLRLIVAGGGFSPGTHLQISMWLGFIFVILLSIGLMSAVFYSSRHGHDDIHRNKRQD